MGRKNENCEFYNYFYMNAKGHDPKACKRVRVQRLEPKAMLDSGEKCEFFTFFFF